MGLLKMSDVWGDITEKIKEQSRFQKLGKGLFVFKLIKVRKIEAVENDYKIASKYYLKQTEKEKGKEEEYKICDVDIEVWSWRKRMRQEFRVEKGTRVHTQISWRIMLQIGRTVLKFKEYDLPVPELIVYWKPDMFTIRYCFITEKMFDQYKEYFDEGNLEFLKHELYWLGKKEYKYNELEWVDWYKKEIENEKGD